MTLALEILAAVMILLAGGFALTGAIGLVKLRDLMQRLHGPTKATTLGVGGVLVASSIYFSATGDKASIHEVLVTLFLFMTAPVTASFIAKVYLHTTPKAEQPPPPDPIRPESVWATYDVTGRGDGESALAASEGEGDPARRGRIADP